MSNLSIGLDAIISSIQISPYAFIDQAFYETMSGDTVDNFEQFAVYINFATEMFEQITNRLLFKRTFSYLMPGVNDKFIFDPEYTVFDGFKGHTFYFPTYPIFSIDKFIISDNIITEADPDVYDSDTEYYLYREQGKLVYRGGFDPHYNKNIKIQYTAGYDNTRKEYYDIQQLTYLMVKYLIDNSDNISSNLVSEKLGNYSYTRMNPKILIKMGLIPPLIYEQILLFKKYAIA